MNRATYPPNVLTLLVLDLPAALDAFFAISIFVNSVSNQTCVLPVWRECSGTRRTATGFRPINISGVAAMGIANAAGQIVFLENYGFVICAIYLVVICLAATLKT